MLETNKIYCGDCLELLPNIDSETVDLILCDLPYGETGNSWDSIIPLHKLVKEYERILKPTGAIALTCSLRFGVSLINAMPHLYKYDIIWAKDNGTNIPNVNLQPMRVHEFILIFGKGRVTNGTRQPMKYFPQKTNGVPYSQKSGRISENWKGGLSNIITDNIGDRHPTTIQYFCRDKDKIHPTQKPLGLFEWIIKSYTEENDLVVDNCVGSGTTALACKKLNRNFIGMDINKDYCDMTEKRLKENTFIASFFREERANAACFPKDKSTGLLDAYFKGEETNGTK
jgi:site-specific DNA-methyltransferase (adenine-specific)